MKIEMRPHQEHGLQLLRNSWKRHKTHQVYMPTGAGKTALAAAIINGFVNANKRVLFIAPYTVLVTQTAQRFEQYGLPKASYIWRDHPDYNYNSLIQIASADTLIRRDFPDNVDLVIVDENHIKRAKLLEIMGESEIPWIGLSGTPFAPWMGKHYHNLVKPTTMGKLIEQGYLSKFEFYAPDKPDMKGVKTSNTSAYGVDYNENMTAEIMGDSTIVGNIVEFWLLNGRNEQTICFAVNVAHANQLTNEFNSSGILAEVMTAKTPHEERQEIFQRFRDGITKIIVNVGVLIAGFDEDVRVLINARPTKSKIRWVQSLGRALRTANGKDVARIFDHSGSVFELGFPDEIDINEMPNGKEKETGKATRNDQEKPEKKAKECKKCHYMKPAGIYKCPKCGHKPLAGEDVEADETRTLKKMGKESVATQEEKHSFYNGLLGWQIEQRNKGKHIKDGAISHKFRDKYGHWPHHSYPRSPQEPSQEVRNFIKYQAIKWAKGRK